MRWIVILFAAGRFAGMAGDAVIRIEIKAVLLIAIWILADALIVVDIE